MSLDLRVLFLFLLLVTGVLFVLRKGSVLEPTELRQIILDFLLVPAAIGTVATFGFLITRTDPLPLLREGAYQLGLRQLVSFDNAIPDNLQNNIQVETVGRYDTDGDNFNEWVVFYKFDLKSSKSPIMAVIYDNDRGNPPVIFPYQLRPPGRDYLSEQPRAFDFELMPVTEDSNGPDGEDLDEILVEDDNQLAIFRFNQNSEIWDFPRDAPPRYPAIGFFRGSGGVKFDSVTKRVTVIDRKDFERSQLAVYSVYELNRATNTYWDSFDSLALAAPVISTIDFYPTPPQEIRDTTFPEKIVLAFYAATCGQEDATLCRNAESAQWELQDFLAEDAREEYRAGNSAYFGLPAFSGLQNISVSHLRYYPALETDPDLLVTGQGRDVVTGEQPQFNLVDINLGVQNRPTEMARFEMGQIEGRWKILRRVEIESLALDAIEIPTAE